MPSRRNGRKRSRKPKRKVSPTSSTSLSPRLSPRKLSSNSVRANIGMSNPLQQVIRSSRTIPRMLYGVEQNQQTAALTGVRPRSAGRPRNPSSVYLGKFCRGSSTKSLVQKRSNSRSQSSSERLLRQLNVSSGVRLKKVPERYDLRSSTFFHRGVRLRRRRDIRLTKTVADTTSIRDLPG